MFRQWYEATQPFKDKLFDPALMTFQEFWQYVNPGSKYHSSSAYNWSINKMNENKSDYPKLLYRKTINGISFEFRVKIEDLYRERAFAKYDPEGEEIVRINGQIQYYTYDELVKLGKHRRYDYSFAIFHGNQCVGIAQDEWGCVLVSVAEEYRQFGLGTLLTKLAWEAEPGKETGGCTPKGAAITRKVHAEFVREYLQKGFYSLLVQQGKLTTKRAKEIIASANLQTQPHTPKDFNTDNPDNWLLYQGNGTFILYDKRLKDLYTEEDYYWKNKCIKAIGDVGGMMHEDENYRLRRLNGETEQLKKFMLWCCVTWTAEEGNKSLYVYEDELPLADSNMYKVEKERSHDKNAWVSLKKEPINYKAMAMAERRWRKQFDKYNEFYHILLEMAEAKWD
jgi:hypothetical protein